MTISVKEIPGYKDIQTECIYEWVDRYKRSTGASVIVLVENRCGEQVHYIQDGAIVIGLDMDNKSVVERGHGWLVIRINKK
jgi:hypothetical protein